MEELAQEGQEDKAAEEKGEVRGTRASGKEPHRINVY